MNLSDKRNEYGKHRLDIDSVDPDAIVQFGRWMEDAINAGIVEPTAMTMASVDSSGKPSARMVLLKGFDHNGFVFFSNYKSRKGRELETNPNVALVFFWKELERQVRIEGTVLKVSREESDDYFRSRPLESRASAVVSPQSEAIADRQSLERQMMDILSMDEKDLVRPSHWGGYRVVPEVVEFWQGRPGRLHDRIRFTRDKSGWKIERIAP